MPNPYGRHLAREPAESTARWRTGGHPLCRSPSTEPPRVRNPLGLRLRRVGAPAVGKLSPGRRLARPPEPYPMPSRSRVPPERERQSLADELSPSEAEEEALGGAWPPQLPPESQPPPSSPVHPAPSVPPGPLVLLRRLWQPPSLHPRPQSVRMLDTESPARGKRSRSGSAGSGVDRR